MVSPDEVASQVGDICSWFEGYAIRTPHALAVCDGARTITYAELNAWAGRLAKRLQARSVGPGSLVAIAMERSLETAVAMIGVVKAGAAFLPLDISHPEDRLTFIIEDAGASLLLRKHADLMPCLAAYPFIDVRETMLAVDEGLPPASPDRSQALAYVIYTSGSTGRPKGVEVCHASLSNMVSWHRRYLALGPADTTLQLAGGGFDATMLEWWGALASGASIHVIDDATRSSPASLAAYVRTHRVTVAFMPTPLGEAYMAEPMESGSALRVLYVGGDTLHRVPSGLPYAVHNYYGPTEATVVCTAMRVDGDAQVPPPIGHPIDGVHIYILGTDGAPVANGETGEIFVGGACVARGYRGQPELTAERFIPDPFSADDGARMYASGDRARLRSDGALEFIGRNDSQVKIRGYRIEIGEVQAALAAEPGVVLAAVRMIREGEPRLVAYIEAAAGMQPDVAILFAGMARRIPGYMLPAQIVVLDRMPVDRNGKIDLSTLASIELPVAGEIDASLMTDTEVVLVSIWGELFGRDSSSLGPDSDFFVLGGHSLLLVRLATALRGVMGVDPSFPALFEARTLRGMAALVDSTRASALPVASESGIQLQVEEMEW